MVLWKPFHFVNYLYPLLVSSKFIAIINTDNLGISSPGDESGQNIHDPIFFHRMKFIDM